MFYSPGLAARGNLVVYATFEVKVTKKIEMHTANVCKPSAHTTGAALGRGFVPVDQADVVGLLYLRCHV